MPADRLGGRRPQTAAIPWSAPHTAQKATLPVRCKKQTLRPVIQRILILSAGVATLCPTAAERVQSGVLAAYDFASTEGAVVKDRSGVVPALDLRIDRPGNVRRQPGSVEIRNTAAIRSNKPPTKILNAVKRSNALTVEVWFRSADLTQEGPARLFTISGDTSNRNLTLGQEGPALQARLRTTRTSNNGMPAIETGRLLKTTLTHAVYTRDALGKGGELAGQIKIALGRGGVVAFEAVLGEQRRDLSFK